MSLSGHEAAWAEWRAALASPRLHHAWILSGIKGIGKGAFARAAAWELVAEPGAAQAEGEFHPDILVLDNLPANDDEDKKRAEGKPYQTKRNITVDQIRRMQQRLTVRPTLGSRRAVIIDPADDMEKGAVNALLKSLEEPPQGTYFLLVTHRPGRLLATVRSRCRTLPFPALPAAEIDAILRREVPEADAETRAAAVAVANGSPGAALDFAGRGLGSLHRLMTQILVEGDPALALRGGLAEALGARPDRDRLLATLDLARSALAGELAGATREQQARIVEAHAAVARLSGQAQVYNYYPGLLLLEIGHLLASAAAPREIA